MKRTLSVLKPLVSLGALLAGITAFAQTPTALPEIELERLTLNPSGTGSLVLGTGELLQKGALRLSLTGHYEHDPLVSQLADGTIEGSVVQHRVTGHLAGAYGITDWLEVSAQVPLVLMQQSGHEPLPGLERPAEGMALGTPYVGVRVGLPHREDGRGVDLAVGLNAGLPLGSAEALTKDARLRYLVNVMAGKELGPVRVGLDAGVLLRRTTAILNDTTEVGDALRLGAAVSTTGKGLRGELNVLGHIPLHNEPRSLEALAGARLPLSSSFEAYALAGVGLGRSPGTPDFRGLLGVAYSIQPDKGTPPPPKCVPGTGPDLDCDEVDNSVDQCPKEPGVKGLQGCPDRDGDGIADREDKCPDVFGVKAFQGCPDKDGDGLQDSEDKCPDVFGVKAFQGCPDGDDDGIQDSEDLCPALFGPKEFQGCPDTDKDGLHDKEDKCPSIAGPKEFQGCPDTDKDGLHDFEDQCPSIAGEKVFQGCPDTDKDTVPDQKDRCPFLYGPVDNQGCPREKEQKKPTEPKESYKTEPIHFGHKQADITAPKNIKVLDTLAAYLNANPEYDLEIQGHTDESGTTTGNDELSKKRANAVREELEKRKVDPSRLKAVGFGESKPLEPKGKGKKSEKNRRVEFILTPRNDKQP